MGFVKHAILIRAMNYTILVESVEWRRLSMGPVSYLSCFVDDIFNKDVLIELVIVASTYQNTRNPGRSSQSLTLVRVFSCTRPICPVLLRCDTLTSL